MRKISLITLAIALITASAFAANQIGAGTVAKGYSQYIWVAGSQDSAGQALSGSQVDSLVDTLTTTGTLWYDLGPCSSNPNDSGSLGIVEDGAAGVGCSLFVTMSSDLKLRWKPNWRKYVSGNASIITDSCNATGDGAGASHIYTMPSIRGKTGFRYLLKLYDYAGGAVKGCVKQVTLSRQAE